MKREDIQKLFESGVGLIVASSSPALRPEISDAEAVEFETGFEQLKVYGLLRNWQKLLANIKTNPTIAVSASHPSNNSSFQFKGSVKTVRPATESERKRAQLLSDQYRQQIALIGVDPYVANALDLAVDSVLEMQIAQVFEQTPGAQAGRSLQWGPK